MAIKEYRKKDVAGLRQELAALRKEQFNLRMAAASGQPARPDQHGKVRRNIARVKTLLTEQGRARTAGSKS
jgi:large subunit ribosomal protein L29